MWQASQEMFKDIGVHTGNCSRLLIHKEKLEGIALFWKGKYCSVSRLATQPLVKHWYSKKAEVLYPRSFTEYERVRIVLRQTYDPCSGARSKVLFSKFALACFGSNQWSDEETVAYKTHCGLFFYINLHTRVSSKSFPQVKISHLRFLPTCPSFLQSGKNRQSGPKKNNRHGVIRKIHGLLDLRFKNIRCCVFFLHTNA